MLLTRSPRSPDLLVRTALLTFSMRGLAARGRFLVFLRSGRIETQAIAELNRLSVLQPDYRSIFIDPKDVGVVDRDVMRFLARCEAEGAKLENCTPYIREWTEREKD